MTNLSSIRTILILAANPKKSSPRRLDEEVREIDEGLRRATQRDQFELEQKWAVRPRDVQRAILDLKPQIVHFSGHGSDPDSDSQSSESLNEHGKVPASLPALEGLVLEDNAGDIKVISSQAIAGLFEMFNDQVECVLLNACYSEKQADAIAQHIPYVIGMNQAVGDSAAREFSVGFYDALGAGRDIEFAFKFGCNAIRMAGIPEDLTPVLKQRSNFASENKTPPKKELDGAPHLELPDGQVGIDSDFYIASSYEQRCHQEIEKPGSLIRIKSPHKMGKSSLMVRVLDFASHLDYRTVMIDLNQTNQKFFHDLDLFMQWFCASVGKPLGIRVKAEEYWDDIFGANDNATDYFENYLLEDDRPLVLVIDNFDRVFDYVDIETDFCGMLRGWYERSKTKKLWEKLRLIIVHSQESYAQKDINQSPFNVGLPIELGEFTSEQVQDLVARHGLTWDHGDLERLMALIGGHPYLVRLALYYLAKGDFSIVEFLKTAPTEAGVYSDFLRGLLKTLEDYPDLGVAMRKVVTSDGPVSLRSNESFKLDSMGLVVRIDNDVLSRCHLYQQYFRERLGVNE